MMNKMDRIAQRARTGQEDAQMLAGIDQAQLDAMVDAILEAKRILWQAGAEREMLEEFSQWIVRRSAFNPIV